MLAKSMARKKGWILKSQCSSVEEINFAIWVSTTEPSSVYQMHDQSLTEHKLKASKHCGKILMMKSDGE